tara:strand:+ start:2491 stop:2862 length:372 start_codon:yes stop_codon:yes gene_type:complete
MEREFFDDDTSIHLFQLVHMLQRSAMMHMGLLQDTEGKVHYNLGETKAAIDTLSMLKNKMSGNLTNKESTMMNGIISELQLQFVKAPSRQRELEDQVAESEAVRETFTNPQKGPSEIIVDEEE